MRWNKSLIVVSMLGAALFSFSSGVFAGPSYNHAGVALGATNLDDGDRDGNGIQVDGSFAPTQNVHVFGSYASWDLDGPVDRSDYTVGAGVHPALSPSTDVVGELFYTDREYDTPGNDHGNDGLGLRAGLRSMVTPRFDVGGGLVHYNLDENDATGIYGTAYYKIVPEVAAGGQVELTDEQSTLLLGGRYYF